MRLTSCVERKVMDRVEEAARAGPVIVAPDACQVRMPCLSIIEGCSRVARVGEYQGSDDHKHSIFLHHLTITVFGGERDHDHGRHLGTRERRRF